MGQRTLFISSESEAGLLTPVMGKRGAAGVVKASCELPFSSIFDIYIERVTTYLHFTQQIKKGRRIILNYAIKEEEAGRKS